MSDAKAKENLPPPSFLSLISGLATQAMVALGVIQIDETKKPEVDLEHARYVIDLLGVLEGKTKGNLSPEEASQLKTILHELRMAFVEVSKATPKST